MTDTELDDLEAKAKAAQAQTIFPWYKGNLGQAHGDPYVASGPVTIASPDSDLVADHIAAANPAVVLKLIAEVRELRTKNAWLLRWAPAEDECQTPGGCTRENCGGECDE